MPVAKPGFLVKVDIAPAMITRSEFLGKEDHPEAARLEGKSATQAFFSSEDCGQ